MLNQVDYNSFSDLLKTTDPLNLKLFYFVVIPIVLSFELGKFRILEILNFLSYNWTSPFFCFKGCWVVFLIFIQILIYHSVSKQWRS